MVGSSSGIAGLEVFLAEFEALAASAPPALPTTDSTAGVAIAVLVVLVKEDEAVADSVALPGMFAVASITGYEELEFDEPVASITGELDDPALEFEGLTTVEAPEEAGAVEVEFDDPELGVVGSTFKPNSEGA